MGATTADPRRRHFTERDGPGRSRFGHVRYRFLDASGDPVAQNDFADHDAALAWARDQEELDEDVQRVEFLGPEGDWRWAGALQG